MENKTLITALGIGMVAGGALSMVIMPRARRSGTKKAITRALKDVGGVIDDVTAVFGR